MARLWIYHYSLEPSRMLNECLHAYDHFYDMSMHARERRDFFVWVRGHSMADAARQNLNFRIVGRTDAGRNTRCHDGHRLTTARSDNVSLYCALWAGYRVLVIYFAYSIMPGVAWFCSPRPIHAPAALSFNAAMPGRMPGQPGGLMPFMGIFPSSDQGPGPGPNEKKKKESNPEVLASVSSKPE